MKRIAFGAVAVGLVGLATAAPGWLQPAPQPIPLLAVDAAAPLAPDLTTVAVRIPRGGTLGGVLADRGLSAREVREAALQHYDLASIRPDRELQLVYTDGVPEPVGLRYRVDGDRTLVVDRSGDGWAARMEEVAYETTLDTRELTLTRSLWQDGLDAGLRPLDLVTLARIFEYEVDFNTELRAGAHLALVADVQRAEGRKDRLATVHAIRLENDGEVVTAVRHELPDGTAAFFHPDGTSMKKPFLRSPLEFSRVTSGFNPDRFHPILERVRPHNGVDFGAATGTPVRAVADAVVTFAGRRGGHGNFVKLKHDRRYQTSYSHLSRIRVDGGERVRQGDIIGEVGATGLATGPHLHYQMWRDGRYVDPLEIELPSTAALPDSEQAAFAGQVARWLPMLARDGSSEGE